MDALPTGERRALQRQRREESWKPDWLAGAAVQMVPALPVFPANGEFSEIAASGAPETVNNGVVKGLLVQIPCATEQGILAQELSDAGNVTRRPLEGGRGPVPFAATLVAINAGTIADISPVKGAATKTEIAVTPLIVLARLSCEAFSGSPSTI